MNRALSHSATLFSVLAIPALVRADQVVITDVMYTHSADTTSDSHYRVEPQAGTPTDWTKPVDYSKGTLHVLLEVKTKPAGDTPTKFQICLEGTPDYACSDQSPTYTKVDKYEWDSRFADFWYGGDVDWSKGVSRIALILKDTNNNKPQGDPKYVPTDLHVQVTLVSPGATFMPTSSAGSGGAPAAAGGSGGQGGGGRGGRSAAGSSGSGSGGGGSAAVSGSGGAAGSGGGGGAARDAGTGPDAGVDAGSAGRSTGSAGVGSAGSPGTGAGGTTGTRISPATGAGSVAETAASGGKDDSGCSTTGRSGPASGALILLALAILRRRKQRALG